MTLDKADSMVFCCCCTDVVFRGRVALVFVKVCIFRAQTGGAASGDEKD